MEEQEMFDEIVSRFGQELKCLAREVGQGRVSVAGVELRLQRLLRETGREASGELLEAADAGLCRAQKIHDQRTRTVRTLFGPVDVTRRRTVAGRYPLDEALGLEGRHGWTSAVQEAVSLLGAQKSFQSACELLEHLLGLELSPPAAQQIAESAGRRAEGILARHPEPVAPPAAKTLILEVDGCQAPQRDGWHEVKVACLWPHQQRVKTASGRGKLLYKQYLASLQEAQAFGWQVWKVTQGWQVGETGGIVAMGDGAPWIWNLVAEHFPGAIEIVDFYHAVEHLWSTGEALWGDRTASGATRSWVRYYRHHLRRGRVDLVLAAIARAQASVGPLASERQLIVRRNQEYFATNQQRMRYALFKRWHLPIGTGAVEGSCKFVVQSRFKLPGCRWSRRGLHAMLALKQLHLNGRWNELWPFRNAA